MLGLCIAVRLAQRGHRVTVFEAAPDIGGLTSSSAYEGITWDRFYHVTEARDQHILGLLDELNLRDAIRWGVTKTNLYDGAALYPLNNVFDYARLPVLGLVDKFRLALNILYGATITDGTALEQQTASEWLRRWSGHRTYDALWRPLLRSKLGDGVDKASAAYIWRIIRRFYGARQGQTKTELFGYVAGGYARIIKALVDQLKDLDVTIKADTAVREISAVADGLRIVDPRDETVFDGVVVTCASPLAAQLCLGLSEEEQQRHTSLQYQGVVCLSMLLRAPLGGAYLTYITDEDIAFTTVIEMSSLVDRAELGGHHLVYLPKYVSSSDPLLDKSDDDIRTMFFRSLKKMFPEFSDQMVAYSTIARARYVSTISTIDYSRHLPPIKTSIPNLYICNSAHITAATLSVDQAVGLANRALTDYYS